jgi:hypothetical protein
VHILSSTFFSISNIPVLDLCAGTHTRLDDSFQRHILDSALPASIKGLALSNNRLGRSFEDLI